MIWGSLKNHWGCHTNIWGFFEEQFWETKGSIENALKTYYGELRNFILDIVGDKKRLVVTMIVLQPFPRHIDM